MFDQFLVGESSLNKLLDPSKASSSLSQILRSSGKFDKFLSPINVYHLAAHSSLQTNYKNKAMEFINKNKANPENIFWPQLLSRAIITAYFFGLFMHSISQSSMLYYYMSAFQSLKLTNHFPNIKNIATRGDVVYKFICGILSGKLPHPAAVDALGRLDLRILTRGVNNFKKNSTIRSYQPLRSNFEQNNNNYRVNSYSKSQYKNEYQKRKSPQRRQPNTIEFRKNNGVTCSRCKNYVAYFDLRRHNQENCQYLPKYD